MTELDFEIDRKARRIKIYGAGLAGLLCGNALRYYNTTVHEKQGEIPHNHDALLRFRDEDFSRMVGMKFKRVVVRKEIHSPSFKRLEPSIKLSNQYSNKVTGNFSNRSINNLDTVVRYIAPPDLVSKMASQVKMECSSLLNAEVIKNNYDNRHFTISTVPVGQLINMAAELGTIPEAELKALKNIEFKYSRILSANFWIDKCDLYQTIYFPDPESMFYRASVTGNNFIFEMKVSDSQIMHIEDDDSLKTKILAESSAILHHSFGIENKLGCPDLKWSVTQQTFGKIAALEDEDRQVLNDFIAHMSSRWKVYSVGRFATWRQLILDDLLKDIGIVEQMILNNGSDYVANRASVKAHN